MFVKRRPASGEPVSGDPASGETVTIHLDGGDLQPFPLRKGRSRRQRSARSRLARRPGGGALTDFLFDGPAGAPWTIALAHGAGAAMDSPFMAYVAAGLAGHGLHVARFEFPYMAGRRIDGKKRGPDRPAVLQACWHSVIDELGPDRLIVGDKSMGGRVASPGACPRNDHVGQHDAEGEPGIVSVDGSGVSGRREK